MNIYAQTRALLSEKQKRVKNIKALLGEMGKELEYYEALDRPDQRDLTGLSRIESALKEFLE